MNDNREILKSVGEPGSVFESGTLWEINTYRALAEILNRLREQKEEEEQWDYFTSLVEREEIDKNSHINPPRELLALHWKLLGDSLRLDVLALLTGGDLNLDFFTNPPLSDELDEILKVEKERNQGQHFFTKEDVLLWPVDRCMDQIIRSEEGNLLVSFKTDSGIWLSFFAMLNFDKVSDGSDSPVTADLRVSYDEETLPQGLYEGLWESDWVEEVAPHGGQLFARKLSLQREAMARGLSALLMRIVDLIEPHLRLSGGESVVIRFFELAEGNKKLFRARNAYLISCTRALDLYTLDF
jgi:hypothetical protein